MLKILAILISSIFLVYIVLIMVVKFINHMDDNVIHDTKTIKIVVSILSGLALVILYLKYSFSIEYFRYHILMIFLILIGYIDHFSKNVYKFISYAFLGIGLIFVFLSGITDIKLYLSIVGGSCLVSYLMAFFCCLGWGDVEVITISSLYLVQFGYLSILNVFLSLALSGIMVVFKVLTRKIKIREIRKMEGTLCPYIALSTYLILIFL